MRNFFVTVLLFTIIVFTYHVRESFVLSTTFEQIQIREMEDIGQATRKYSAAYGLPSTFDHFFRKLTGDNDHAVDFLISDRNETRSGKDVWGTELKIVLKDKRELSIISAGADGVFQTRDDVKWDFVLEPSAKVSQ